MVDSKDPYGGRPIKTNILKMLKGDPLNPSGVQVSLEKPGVVKETDKIWLLIRKV